MSIENCGEKDCGTVSCYVRLRRTGRDCSVCRASKAAYERHRRLTPHENGDNPLRAADVLILNTLRRDGTWTNVKNLADAAGVPVSRLYRMGPSQISKPETPHGVLRKYRHGCRCVECRAANRTHAYKFRKTKTAKIAPGVEQQPAMA